MFSFLRESSFCILIYELYWIYWDNLISDPLTLLSTLLDYALSRLLLLLEVRAYLLLPVEGIILSLLLE